MNPRVSSRLSEGLLYALTAFGPFAFGCVEPWSRAALEILAFLLALTCFLRGRRAPSPTASAFWLFPAAFAALGALQLSTLAAPDGPRPALPFTCAPYATESAVLLWAAYAAVLWSVPRVVVTHEAARRYARVLFGLGLALAALGLLQTATGGDKLYWLRSAPGTENFGPYYNRDHAANFLLMSLAVGLGVFYSQIRGWAGSGGPPPGSLRTLGLLAGGALAIFLGIAVCGSRGAFLAIPLAAAALAVFGADFAKRSSRRRACAAAGLAGAALVTAVVFRYVGASADAGALVEVSVMGRLSIYGDALRWWRDTPLFGTGLGSFETIYPAYQDLELRARVFHAHSDWLEIALESGAAGLLAALAAAALASSAAVRSWHAARSKEMRALIGGALAAVVAFSAHALFEFCFQIPGNAVVFLGLVGFLLSAPAWADKAGNQPHAQPPSLLPSAAAAACFLLMAQAAVRPAAAAWIAGAPGEPADRAAALARGFALDPDPSFLKGLAAILYSTDRDGRPDLQATRLGLGYALAAVEKRPFDADALFLAATGLSRLERPTDALALTEAAGLVRFAPLKRKSEAALEFERAQRKVETLRSLGVIGPVPEGR